MKHLLCLFAQRDQVIHSAVFVLIRSKSKTRKVKEENQKSESGNQNVNQILRLCAQPDQYFLLQLVLVLIPYHRK